MKELYVIKNNKNSIVGKPSTNFDHLWEKASLCESMRPQGAPYVVEKFTLPMVDEALSDKPKMRNKPVERRYYKNGEEMDRDDFYDELVLAEPTDEQMIQLENDPDGITLQGETFRVVKDREKEEDDTKEEAIENPYVSPKPIKESLEDGIINMVVFQNTNSGFYDSIDYFDEDEAQEKADELIANPGKYSHVKIVRMKKNDQKKFLENRDEQDDFYDNGTIPEKYVEEETKISGEEEEITDEEEVAVDVPSLDDEAEGDPADDLSDEEISVKDTENIEDEEEQGVPVKAVRDSEENLKFKDDELEG